MVALWRWLWYIQYHYENSKRVSFYHDCEVPDQPFRPYGASIHNQNGHFCHLLILILAHVVAITFTPDPPSIRAPDTRCPSSRMSMSGKWGLMTSVPSSGFAMFISVGCGGLINDLCSPSRNPSISRKSCFRVIFMWHPSYSSCPGTIFEVSCRDSVISTAYHALASFSHSSVCLRVSSYATQSSSFILLQVAIVGV